MREKKNKTLLIGLICQGAVIVWLVVTAVLRLLAAQSTGETGGSVLMEVIAAAVLLLSLVPSIGLLARNLKQKSTGELLPVLSIAASGLVLALVLYALVSTTLPQYLLLNQLSLVKIYVEIMLDFFLNGGLLFIVGSLFLVLGGFFSLPPKAKKAEKQH